MQRIQKVFEDDSAIAVSVKKPNEDLTPEEKVEFYDRKKKKILGSKQNI
jgi:hypothetical protein